MGYQGRSLSINQYDNSDVIILDDISSGFDGSTSSFTLTQNGANFQSISAVSTFVKLGGIIQTPNEDYTISYSSGVSTINFTTTPLVGLTCEIRTLLGTTVGNVGPDQVRRTNLNLSQTSDPTVDLGAGDLYYNSTNEILKTYNLTNTSWDTVYDRDVLFLNSTNNRVGIGTVDPNENLEVAANSSHRISVRATDTTMSSGSDYGGFCWYTNDDSNPNRKNWDIYQKASGSTGTTDLQINSFSTNDIVVIDSAGNIGLGATSPDVRLHIKEDTSDPAKSEIKIDISAAPNTSYGTFRIMGDGGGSGKYLIGYNSAQPDYANMLSLKNQDGDIAFYTGGVNSNYERLRITSTGDVGIGTDNPEAELEVKNNTQATDSDVAIRLSTVAGQVSARNEIRSGHTNNTNPYMSFAVRETSSPYATIERMRINSDGRIGINSAGYPTDIPGTSHDTVVVGNSAATVGGITLEVASGNNAAFQFYAQGSTPAARMIYYGSANRLDFYLQNPSADGENTILSIREDKDVEIIDGNLRVANGHGIDFSATADSGSSGKTNVSELLDDYEEGDWIPTMFGGTTAGTTTYTHQTGNYTKIGNRVIVSGTVAATTSGASGNLRIGNFPFLAGDESVGTFQANEISAWGSGVEQYSLIIQSGNSHCEFRGTKQSGQFATLTIQNVTYLRFNVSYTV